jgi:hypothetical protein
MARLIPQKQIEEVNIFKDSISVNNNVSISGSLLVSQSINIGSDLTTPQIITGSVEITGSVNIDGDLTFARAESRLDATASFSDVSVDTQRFGGIPVAEFGGSDATVYVSATRGDDSNDGRSPQFPVKTIKRAAQIVTPGDDGRYGLPTGSNFTGFRIDVQAGTYLEDNPVELPRNTTVWGAGLRVTKVVAKNENEDLFWVNSGNYLAEMTFAGLRVFPSVDDSQKGFAISFAPNAFITTSPYVQNCSMISNQENSFLEAYEDIPAGGGGLNVDGNRIHPDSPLASMVLDAYTQVAPNGVGCQVVGRGFIQLVSFFTNFSAYSVKVIDGGQAVLLNSNTSFGDFGMYASGSRFITGSGGNTEAFLNVQDNYSIIVDTIERGLDEIPDLVTNTEDGIKVTDELQIFNTGAQAKDKDAKTVVSDYRLISNLIERGVEDKIPILALSSDRGYNSGSIWNVSGDNQITSSTTASEADLNTINSNYDIVLDIIERGNAATSSYTYVDNVGNVESLIPTPDNPPIKVTGVDEYKTSAVTDDTKNTISSRFDTVISIIKNGVDVIPDIETNTSESYKVTNTSQYITDLSASLDVREIVSSSFSTVYNILDNGTGSAPTIVESSSFENPTIDYQNAYTLLKENIPFIQKETIAYLSSSWSEFYYSESKCERDLGYIISGAAHDLLFGGNEESVRNGNFYYLYPSEATTIQKSPTLTAIKYAAGIVDNILADITFQETTAEVDNAYELLFENKRFIQSESIAYLSSSWSTFDYNEAKCVRDIGYIIDAVATDIKYGGNERSVIAGNFYYKYPSNATVNFQSNADGQLNQTIDGINYAKRLAEKLVKNETFVTQSSSTLEVIDTIFENRSLIQNETITYINTTYPNFSYNEAKCKRDTGYILDAVLTDLKYGGVERTQNAGLYYFSYPSIANTTQLEETLEGIRYSKGFVNEVAKSNPIETPSQQLNINKRIKVGDVDYVTSSISGTDFESKHISGSVGIVEDIIRFGNDSILSAIAENTGSFNWSVTSPLNVSEILQVTASVSTSISSSIFDDISGSFDTVIKIIESGSSVVTEETVGTGSAPVPESQIGDPISTIGIPKDSYGDGLVKTVTTTIIPTFDLVENTDNGIKFGSDTQITGSITSSVSESLKVSSSFSDIIDIIKYGTSGSLSLSGSFDTSTYYEVVTPETGDYYIINRAQLDEFDGVRAGGYFNTEENTGSFSDGIKDPTLTLKRGEMYTFSVNALKYDLNPFYIKTARKPDKEALYNEGVTNNGVNFGTLTFIVPLEAPDRLYYVNGNNVSASGIINVVDNLPISDTQRYIEVPSKGFVEITTNNVDNIKISNISQYSSSFSASVDESHEISSSFATTIEILKNGVDDLPTIVENTSGSIKVTNTSQITSSITPSEYELNSVSSSYAIVIDVLQNGTSSLPTEISNTSASIKVTDVPQYISSSVSGTLENVNFISSSVSIVYNIVQLGSSGSYTASLYDTGSGPRTDESTIAAYEIIRNNIPFIQSESLAYLSSSWSTASYDEVKCGRDIGLIISGAAEDLIWGTVSSSVVNGKFYLEYPSQAETSQLNQTLDGIEYASKLTQKLIQNIEFVTASNEASASHQLLLDNKLLIQNETIEYISSSWSDFVYSDILCRRDIGHIVDAAATDILYGGNERSVQAASFYYSNPSAATGSQLNQTVDAINYARRISNKILQNEVLELPELQTLGVAELISENRSLIQEETIQFLSSSWSTFEYNEAKCRRDTGYIIDAVVTDFVYGGNERAVNAGEFYYLYPSDATGSQLTQTVDGITYAQRLTNKLINNVTLVTSSLERRATKDLLMDNKGLIQNEVIHFISSSWSTFEYNESKCKRDVGYIIDAIATDIVYGGNERSVVAGEFYYRYPSEATTTQLDQTITGVKHAAGLSEKIIQNTLLVNPDSNTLEAYNRIRNNRSMIQSETVEFVDSLYPYFTYNREKCKRDTGFIIDAVATDLLWGGNERSIIAGDYYYRYPSQATTFQLKETVEGIRYAETVLNSVVLNEILERPKIIFNSENHIKIDGVPQYSGSMAISGSNLNEVSSSFEMVNGIITDGIKSFTPTDATYDPATGDFVMTIANHTLTNKNGIYIKPDSFTFTCDMDGNRTEHILPSIGQPAYNNRLEIQSVTTNTITVNVGKSGPNVEFNPTNATYDPATGDFVVTVESHSLSVGEGVIMEAESFAFTCDMDDNQSVKSYPRVGIDPKAVRSIPLTAVTDTTMTFNVGASGPNKYFTPISASYNALSGDMILTVSESFGLGVGRSVVLEDESFAFTCDQDNDATTHSYPRPGSDPYAGKSIVITSVGTTSHTVTDAPYDSATGDVTITITSHGFSNGDYIKLDDNSLTYTCVLDGNTTTKSYPRPNYDYPSGRWLEISNVTTNTFDINIGSSPYVGAHTFVSATNDGLERQDGTFTINVGDAGSASGSLHTFVSASNRAVKHEPQSLHTFVSASDGAIKHLPQSNHTFVRTELSSVSTLPYEIRNVNSLTKVTDTLQVTESYNGSQTQIGIISASIDMINDIIRLGSDDIPFTIAKHFQTSELDTPQQLTTSSYVTASGDYTVSSEKTLVSESFSLINDIIENTTSSIDDFVDNTYNKRKFTNTTQYSSSVSASANEFSIVENRFGIVSNIVENGLSQKPSIIRNNTDIDNLIKVTNTPQYISSSAADKLQAKIISSSVAIVTDIIENGSGSAPAIIEYTTPSDSPKAKLAYQLLKNNLEFIKEETVAYISSSWSTFEYDDIKCKRDVGLIISGAAEDLIWNSNSASVVNGKFYLEYPSQATGSQLQQTLDGINYASTLAQHIVRNRTFVTASNEVSASYNLLFENKEFIQNETIAYLSSSWSDFYYSESKCKRDIGYIVDAVATDLKYNGNERSVIAGDYYYKYPSAAIVGGVPNVDQQKDPTVTGINYAKSLALELVSGSTFQTTSNEVEFVYDSIRENREFIQAETVAFVNAKYPNLQYNEVSCSRDTGFIVDAVATDLRWGGNQRSIVAGQYYYKFPSKATTSQLGETTDAVIYASKLVSELIDKNTLPIPSASLNVDNNIKVMGGTQYTGSISANQSDVDFISSSIDIVTTIVVDGTGSYETAGNYTTPSTDANTIAAYQIIRNNLDFIKDETIAYLSSSWADFDYNEEKCRRDTGLIISGAAEDLIWNSNSASIVNGKFYNEFPSEANGTGSQVEQTLDGLFYASRITQKLIQNIEFVEPTTEVSSSWELLRSNKDFIKDESIAYLSSSWSDFDYNQETCKRDIGHIINAIATDILYGGNERSVIAGNYYYKYPSSATTTQLNPTTTGINYAGDIAENIIVNNVFESPSAERIAGNESLLNNRTFIQSESLAYLTASWSTFEYDKDKCARDVGHIVDAVATDFLYGGNERSKVAGEFYYLYPSEATTIQANQTTDGIKYAGRISEALLQNIQFVTASAEVSASFDLLRKNKPFIQ